MSAALIEAAGGVLWRGEGASFEVAVVHRPKYDDWSLPKGKLVPGEHLIAAACREVVEETGFTAVPGRPLGEVRYLKEGQPKRVRYWAMAAGSGAFQPGDEVDEIAWCPPERAREHLAPDRDRPVLDELLRDPTPTRAAVLVRHASAGDRGLWDGPDAERPLDERGREQAAELGGLLALYRPARLVSANVERCTQTLRPLAELLGRLVETEPLLSEIGYEEDPAGAEQRLLSLVAQPEPLAVCSQGGALPRLITAVCGALGHPLGEEPRTQKGGFWILHVAAGDRALAVERHAPLA